jgi:hypothetical protein
MYQYALVTLLYQYALAALLYQYVLVSLLYVLNYEAVLNEVVGMSHIGFLRKCVVH